jgi:hypothetical protein
LSNFIKSYCVKKKNNNKLFDRSLYFLFSKESSIQKKIEKSIEYTIIITQKINIKILNLSTKDCVIVFFNKNNSFHIPTKLRSIIHIFLNLDVVIPQVNFLVNFVIKTLVPTKKKRKILTIYLNLTNFKLLDNWLSV